MARHAREPARPTTLKRSLGLPLLTLYGLGTLVGGGFCALVGKVAGESGMARRSRFSRPPSSLALSVMSFGELYARFPFSPGESHFAIAR